MSLRTHRLTTHLAPEEALTLIEFLDQLREALMQSYGEEIRAMLKEATTVRQPGDAKEKEPF